MTTDDAVDEIRQELAALYPNLDTAAFGVIGRILRLAGDIDNWRADHLATYHLTPADFNVLATMRRKGADGINPGSLLHPLFITSGGLTKRLDRLEAAGLIERHPDPDDRRATLLRLTEEGANRIDEAIPSLLEKEASLVRAALSGRQIKDTASLLRRLTLMATEEVDTAMGWNPDVSVSEGV
jgi:DNA-binding MarR family transcriptional regulator